MRHRSRDDLQHADVITVNKGRLVIRRMDVKKLSMNQCKRPELASRPSITHILRGEEEAEMDISEAG
jgi:hypothetical protein